MISIIMLGLLLIGVVASASYSMLLIADQTQALVRAQTEKQIIDQAETVIINSLRPIGENQKLISPIGFYDGSDLDLNGVADIDYQQLPKIYGISTKNAWGIEMVYCPISDSIGVNSLPAESIAISDTLDYSAKFVTDHNGIKYTYQTDFAQHVSYSAKNVIAFILSRKPGSNSTCSDVTFSNSKYKASGALVKAITRESVLTYQANKPIMVRASNYSSTDSLNSLSESWATTQPLRFIISLDDNNSRALIDNLNFVNNFPGNNKEIYILGQGSGISNVTSASLRKMTFENTSVFIEGINFGNNISMFFNDSNVKTKDVVFGGPLTANNSEWSMTGDMSIDSTTGNSLELNSSSLNQNGFDLTITGGVAAFNLVKLSNSKWFVNNANVNLTSFLPITAVNVDFSSSLIIASNSNLNLGSNVGSGVIIDIDETSQLSVADSSIVSRDTNQKAIFLSGKAMFDNSSILANGILSVGVDLINGGSLALKNSNIGTLENPLANGVIDNGSRLISGTGSSIFASTNCWSGQIFTDFKNTAPINSGSTNSDYFIFNQSSWSCN